MMDYRSFQSYYVRRGIRGARSEHEIDRYAKRAKASPLNIMVFLKKKDGK